MRAERACRVLDDFWKRFWKRRRKRRRKDVNRMERGTREGTFILTLVRMGNSIDVVFCSQGAMVEAKRRLDAVLARRDALVNHEGGRSPVVVDVDDDSHSDLDGGSHHRVNTHTGSGSDTIHGADDDDFYAKGVGPFDDAAHVQGGYGTPSIGDSDAAGGQSSAATWIAAALFAVFAALAIRKVRKRRRAKR